MTDRRSFESERGLGGRSSGRRLAVGALFAALLPGPAHAVPCPGREDGEIARVSCLQKEAQQKGSSEEKIEILTAALQEIPGSPGFDPLRARVLLSIVEAYNVGIKSDRPGLEKLKAARDLLNDYLGSLELLDEEGRAEVETKRKELFEKIDRLEKRLKKKEDDEKEKKLKAKSAAEAAETARKQKIAAEDAIKAAEEAEQARRRADEAEAERRTLRNVGAATTAAGLAGFVVMGAGMGIGRAAELRLAEGPAYCPAIDDVCAQQKPYWEQQIEKGDRGNAMVIAGAAAGGVLLTVGLSLLLVAHKKKSRSAASASKLTPAPMVARDHVGLALIGRF